MRTKTWLALPLLLVTACGDDDGPAVTFDAPPTADPDAPTGGTPDADLPNPPDANVGPMADANLSMYDFSCAGMAPPSTAPDPLILAGTVSRVSTSGSTVEEMVQVEARDRADDAVLGSAVTDAMGAFSISYDNPTMLAVDGYVAMTKMGLLDTYIFPPDPLFESIMSLDAGMIEPGTVSLIYTLFGGGQSYNAATSSTAVVLVVDCAGTPIEGATVSFDPPAGAVRYLDGMTPSGTMGTDASGTAFGFNVPVGTGTIANASYMGTALEGHTFGTYVNSLSVTIVHP